MENLKWFEDLSAGKKKEARNFDKFKNFSRDDFSHQYQTVSSLYYDNRYEKCCREGIDLLLYKFYGTSKWQNYLNEFVSSSCKSARNKSIKDATSYLQVYSNSNRPEDYECYLKSRDKAIEFTYYLIDLEHQDEFGKNYYKDYPNYWKWARALHRDEIQMIQNKNGSRSL